MTTITPPIETVRSLYAAFGRGDIGTILAALHPDVHWHVNVDPNAAGAAKVLMFKPRHGVSAVHQFFVDLAGSVEVHAFVPRSFMSGDHEVAVHVVLEFTVRSTGKRLSMAAIHHWTFDADGKVSRFTDFFDTLGEANAWNAIKSA